MALWIVEAEPVELRSNAEETLQAVIRAVYRQVLSNQHVMESQRLTSGESLLRHGDISVAGFVRLVAKSDLYRSLFFDNSSPYRSIELNFKHLLGRAPISQAEISEHVLTYNTRGYAADIDSYIDSSEYQQNFGENIVPYARGQRTEAGISNISFNRTFALNRGFAANNTSPQARLIADIGGNLATKIKAPIGGSGTYSNIGKRFRVTVTKAGGGRITRSNMSYEVNYDQLSQRIQNIQKAGGKIVSIAEVA